MALRSLAVAAGLSLIAACGSVAAPSGQAPRHATPDLGPPGGSPAQATRLARRLLAELRLPAGAHAVGGPIPAALGSPGLYAGAIDAVDVHRMYALAAQPATALAEIAGRQPAGLTKTGSTSGSLAEGVSYAPKSLPAWAYAAQLLVNVTGSKTGGTLLRIDAQVLAYPSRTAAEYIDPARYHVLTISVSSMDSRPHGKRVVVTSAAAIADIARLVNRSHAEATVTANCPAIFANYRLAFAVTRHSAPAVVLTATMQSCLGIGVTVLGHKQPTLAVSGALVSAADRLLGYTPRI